VNTYRYSASLVKVVDGDTLDFMVDLGFNISHKVRVRLYGVNTPELKSGSEDAKVAKQFTTLWLAACSDLTVETIKDKSDKYGRFLAKVWDGDKCLNTDLLVKGLAVPYFGQGST